MFSDYPYNLIVLKYCFLQVNQRRYIKTKEGKKVKTIGYSGTAKAKRVFTKELEKELADHIKKLADQFHGLTPQKCCELAFELADRNNIPVPNNWKEKGVQDITSFSSSAKFN